MATNIFISTAGRAQTQTNLPAVSPLSCPDACAVFRNFAVESGARQEKERGIRRLGLAGNLGLGHGALLQFTHSDVSAGGSGILRQGLTLTGGGLSLRASYVRVGEDFSRFGDLADKDRDALEKLRGGEQLDLSGQWAMGRSVKVEGGLLHLTQNRNSDRALDRKSARLLLSLAPNRRSTLSALSETSENTEKGTEQSRSLVRFTGATQSFGLALRGSYETEARRTISNGARTAGTDTATTLLGLRSAGNGPLRLSLESKNVRTRCEGAPDRHNAALLSEIGLQLGRSGRASCTLGSDIVTEGQARTENHKQRWGLELGRGYRYRRSLEGTQTRDGRGSWCIRRTEFTEFATDPAEPLFASGERRALSENGDTREVYETWKGGLTLGGLTLRADGLGIRRLAGGTPEKNNNLSGKLLLPAGWSATYVAFDRTGKDPRTGLDRDEAGEALTLGGVLGALRVTLKSLSYADRRDASGESPLRELTLATARPLSLGPLRQGALTLACGRTRALTVDGLLGGHRLAFEYADLRLSGGQASTPGKGFRFTTSERCRLRVDLRCRTRQLAGVRGPEPIRTRLCSLDWRIAGAHTLSYSRALNPERTDGTVEKRRAETIRWATDLGRGGKIAADYCVSAEPDRGARTRSTSFCLVSPASEVCGYELSCLRERACAGSQRGETRTYRLTFQFYPEDGAAQVAIAARWIDRAGDLPGGDCAGDEAQASVEMKLSW